MQVKESEFVQQDRYSNRNTKYLDLTVISNTDSGLFAVQYEKQEDIKRPTIDSMRNSYNYSNAVTVEITIQRPTPRKVLRTLTVIKTSANCYRATYADAISCSWLMAKNYDEIHAWLAPLWARRVDLL